MSTIEKIVDFLKARGKAPTFEIVSSIGLNWDETLKSLLLLESSGIIRRLEVLDLAKPLATTVWALQEPKPLRHAEFLGLGSIVGLILNPPLLKDLKKVPPGSMGLLDSLSYAMSFASKSLRIAMPYIGELMSTLFMQHMQDLKKLSAIKVITEDLKGNRRALEPLKGYLPNLHVRYATKIVGGVKVAGVHLKVLIADEQLAIIGTFNLTQTHLLVNYDLGLILKGDIVRQLSEIFDTIWNRLSGEEHET